MNFIRTNSLVLLTSLLLLFSLCASAQKGKAKIIVYPEDAVIRVDTQLVTSMETIVLDTGMHSVRSWTKNHRLIEKQFRVVQNNTTYVKVSLPYSEDYEAYRKSIRMYHRSHAVLRYGVPIGYLTYVGVGLYQRNKLANDIAKNKERGDRARELYENATIQEEVQFSKEAYNRVKRKYDEQVEDYNKMLVRQGLLFAGGAAAAALSFYLSYKVAYPVYKDKVLLTGVYIPSESLGSTAGFGLALNVSLP